MKNLKKTLLNNQTLFIVNALLIFTNLFLFSSLINLNEWQIEYKKEVGKAFDDDYLNFSKEVNANITGMFSPKTKNIIIYWKGRPLEELDKTYYHEKCHLFENIYLNESQIRKYQSIFKKADYFVSKYAKSEWGEDFAESCQQFILNKSKLDNTRLRFFQENGLNVLKT